MGETGRIERHGPNAGCAVSINFRLPVFECAARLGTGSRLGSADSPDWQADAKRRSGELRHVAR